MKVTKDIGIVHSITQIVSLGIYSGGIIFLLPLVLAEITGWVMLGLWAGLNFLGLPLIIKLLDITFPKRTSLFNLFKIIMTGLTGGLLALSLYILYYRFHMFSIKKDFSIHDYYDDFLPVIITMTITMIIAELIRKKETIFWRRQSSNSTP